MKILLILNPPCVQRFALTTIASPGSVVTISKHMHPFGAESITKPLKAIARRARWDYRAPENLSIIREGRDEKRERERERERRRKIRAYVQNRPAYINSHDGNWIKVAELFAGTLHTRVLARRNASQLSRDTMRSHSNARRNGSPSAPSKKGSSYQWNVAIPTVGSVIRLQRAPCKYRALPPPSRGPRVPEYGIRDAKVPRSERQCRDPFSNFRR